MPILVQDKKTPLPTEESLRVFARSWKRVLGRDPIPRALAALVAHGKLECGAQFESLHWWNFGNEKAGAHYLGKYCMYRCNEVIDGVVRWFDPPHPQTWFRAFDSAEDGASEHVSFLAVDSNHDGKNIYAAAWACFEAGDPEGAVRAMKAAHYFTGNLEAYVHAVVSITNMLEPIAAKILNGEDHELTADDRGRIEGLVALTTQQSAEEALHGADTEPPPKDA
jgi:hypothetical protein